MVCRFDIRQPFAETKIGVQDVGWIQREPLFNNLLPTPPSTNNCMVSMAHAMRSGSTGASFARMNEGMQV